MSKALPAYGILIDGKTGQDPEPDNDSFETLTSMWLAPIYSSRTGRAILHKTKAHGRVRIVPRSFGDFFASRCNAAADPEWKIGPVDENPFSFVRSVDVSWSPTGILGCSIREWKGGPGGRPDEVLLHELVHAGRILGFDFDQVPLTTDSMKGYGDEEEYFAVLISNIYISEKGRAIPNLVTMQSGLRLDHGGFNQLPVILGISEVFLGIPDNYKLVKKYCSQQTIVAPMIAQAAAAFNPIKTYYDWVRKGIKPGGV